MYLKQRIVSTLSSTSAHDGDSGVVKTPASDEIRTDLLEGGTRTYRIADGAANQAIDLGGVASVRHVSVKTDREIALRINGSESITITPPDEFSFGHLLVNTSGVTALDVSNDSGGTAVVQIQLAGDPA